jgi:(+)-pinoresinol hydroxylase
MTPAGIASSDFSAAIAAFAAVVGNDWIFTSDDDLDLYKDSYSPLKGQPDERVASAAVAPKSADEVQAIVKIANRYGIPLYPISTGKNLGYGGAAPNYSGSVVLDLKRMNRIIEVDADRHYAIVEPGVSYFDLFNYITERNLDLWIDCPDPGWGSLIGNALDHGVGYTAGRFRNHFDAHCGLEVVLADGDVLRTGMGAMPKSNAWGEFKAGYGPIVDGIFSQSNFGIVTKMGFWLMPKPDAVLQATVRAPRYEDLDPLIKFISYVENSGLAPGMPQMGSPLLGLGNVYEMVGTFYNGPPAMPDEQRRLIEGVKVGYSAALANYGLNNKIPYWDVQLTFYGPEKVVAAQWEAAKERALAAIPGATFQSGEIMKIPLTDSQKRRMHVQQVGIPNLEFFAAGARSKGNPNPTAGHLWFAPVIQRSAASVIEINRVFEDFTERTKLPLMGLKPFALPICLFERAFLIILGFPVTDDPDLNKRFVSGFGELIRVAADHGWGEYRTPTIFQDQAMKTYSFNDNALLRFHEKLKDAVDPKGIISAGRYGIWPQHLRSR